ncbi:MAG: CHAP domain-containing protein [Acidimicrobiaceae bacterium]|nr:CHAP domain-containing protein [Acidimicrobiaceae bacterium]MYE75730.1 CHAP domain-containing protein [Acidimicrobiaceae bacterium]MYJ42466.1 CHAP domain-containing protein [Acidimicrobiaceae bacterium]
MVITPDRPDGRPAPSVRPASVWIVFLLACASIALAQPAAASTPASSGESPHAAPYRQPPAASAPDLPASSSTPSPEQSGSPMVPPQPAAFAGTGTATTVGSTGATLAAQSPYSDVAPTGVHHDAIRVLAADGVFVGTDCGAGRFCPNGPLPRSTLAVWLVRVLDGTDPSPVAATRFADVSADHPHAAFIERFAHLDITTGCGDGTRYCPDDTVTRAQMAVFLARAFNLPDGPDPGFSDVTPDAWYAPAIAELAASGVTTGCGDGTRYCPDDTVTRAEMASFLHRARTLPQHLELNVFYCGPSGVYDEARLQDQVDLLQQHVDGFYRRQSGYDASGGTRGTTITFRVGGILPADILPSGHNWKDQTLDDWHDKSSNRRWGAAGREDRWKDPCVSAAEALTENHRSVILVNIASGPSYTLGYGVEGTTGPAILLTRKRQVSHYGRTQEQFFYYTVAHEIGHAFYDWSHPLEDDQLNIATTEQIMSVMSRPTGMHEHSGTVRLDLAPGPNSAYIACYHLAQHNWVELDADGQCQRPDSTASDEQGGPEDPDDPSGLELRISWGDDASSRSDCPPATSCRYLRYEYIGDWPQPPYQTECWSKGQRGFGPFDWLGDPSRGCIFWDDDETAQVVVNGIRSNEITFSDRTPPPTTTLPRTKLSTSYPTVTDCWGRDPEWDGYQLGQCTSYVAWRLRENGVGENDRAYVGHYGFFNQWRAAPCAAIDRARVARWGHARQWDDCAERIGIRVDKSPAPGSVLVRNDTALDRQTGQFFGHLAYVEATNPDGSIVISDGNYNGKCGIRASHTVTKGTGPYQGDYRFIHFEEHAKRLAN